MEVQSIDHSTDGGPSLAKQIELARGVLGKLRDEQFRLEESAAKSQLVFDREPTAKAHTDAAVAAQKAKNAAVSADHYERETLTPLLKTELLASMSQKREQLSHDLDPSRVREQQDKIQRAIEHCVAEVESASAVLATLLERRYQLSPEAAAVGLGVDRFRFEPLIAQINDRIQPLRGNIHEVRHAGVVVHNHGNSASIRVDIARPVAISGLVL